jgi:ABC-2 type transport system ATP-binding protein
VLALHGVTKRYGRRTALQNVTLNIGAGVTGLLGPNGSGKSTLIKALLGLVSIQAGSAEVLGFELPRQLRAIRDSVGYLPEDDCFIAGLTGIESVQFMARLSGLEAVEGLRRAHEVLDSPILAKNVIERRNLFDRHATETEICSGHCTRPATADSR